MTKERREPGEGEEETKRKKEERKQVTKERMEPGEKVDTGCD